MGVQRALGYAVCVWLVVGGGWLTGCSEDVPTSGQNHEDELPEMVSAKVGPQGATLKAKGVTLDIPEGALDKDVVITARNVGKTVSADTKAEAVSDVYEFGPEGTKFLKDVKVSFEVADKEDATKATVYFTKENEPEVFEKLATEREPGKVAANTKHFSMGFAGVDLQERDSGLDSGAMDLEPDGGLGAEAGTAQVDSGGADAGPAGTLITVHSHDFYGTPGNQTWGAYQDGDGAWQAIAPSATGLYEFHVTAERYGVVFVCASPDNQYSLGELKYAATSTTTLDVDVGEFCWAGPSPATFSLTGELTLPANATEIAWGHATHAGFDYIAAGPPPTYEVRYLLPGVHDVVLAVADDDGQLLRGVVIRGLEVVDQDRVLDLDFDMLTGSGGYAVTFDPGSITVENATIDTYIYVDYAVQGGSRGMTLRNGATTGETSRVQPYHMLPISEVRPDDRYRIHVREDAVFYNRSIMRYSKSGGDLTMTLDAPYDGEITQLADAYSRVVSVFDDDVNATTYTQAFDLDRTEGSAYFRTSVNPEWFPQGEGVHTLTFPDFSGVPGFSVSWAPGTSEAFEARAGVVKTSETVDGITTVTNEIKAQLNAE